MRRFVVLNALSEKQTREIRPRKALDVSVFNLWRLLSREFVILVLISLMIAIPVSWYFLHSWLEHYAYRISMSWWLFALAGSGAMK